MRRVVLSSLFTCVSLVGLAGCAGDDTEAPLPDAGGASSVDAGRDATATTPADGSASDTGVPATDAPGAADGAADAATSPGFLTLSYQFDSYKQTEYAVFDLTAGHSVGDLKYAGFGVNMSTARGPWALEQKNDVVLKLDPASPWIPTASWNIGSPAPEAGGFAYADAFSVAETATQAYVSLYNRSSVVVLDTTGTADAGTPIARIDLSSFLEPGDADGSVEASAALYDDATRRVWVVLQNIDEDAPYGGPPDYDAQCVVGLTSVVVAIDTTTNALVPNLKYVLSGINPTSVVLDPVGHRLLALDVGCTKAPDAGDAGPGPLTGRLVEAIDLGTGASTILLNAKALGRPSGLAYTSATLAFVGFGGSTYAWDPATPSLGAALPNTPDVFAWDGHGLVGPRTNYLGDGGVSIDVIEVDPLTGAATVVGPNPVSTPDPATGFFESVDLWPRP